LLGHPRSTRCTARRWTSTTNSTYSRVSPMVSTVKKSVAAGRWPGRVGLRPARPAPPRCGSDPVATQDPSYRGRRHPNAEVAALPRRPSGNPSGGSPAPAVPPGRRPVRPDRAGHDRSADRSTGGRLAPGATAARSRALLGMPPTARAATSSLTPLAASDPQGVPRTRYLAAQHRQLMPKYGDLHGVGVRCRTAAEHTQNLPNDHQSDRMKSHTIEPAAPTSPQTSAVILTWHPTRRQALNGRVAPGSARQGSPAGSAQLVSE